MSVSLASGILMFKGGGNLAPIGQLILSFPALGVSLASVILRFTSVDVSLALGILMFTGGRGRT